MRTVPSIADLTRTAAERGLTVGVGGRLFNSQADRMRAPKPAPAAPAAVETAPVIPPPPPGVTREELDRALADRDALWERRMQVLQAMLDRPTELPRLPPSWQFVPEYDAKGAISCLIASPIDNATPESA